MSSTIDYAMYILVNKELNMSPGKIASQVGHITEKLAIRIIKSLYEDDSTESITLNFNFSKYIKNGHKKIILYASQKEMDKLKSDKNAEYIIDEGKTEIPPDSLTVVGFLPSNTNKDKFKSFRLV